MRPSRGGHAHAIYGRISRFSKGRTILLRCESLEPPTGRQLPNPSTACSEAIPNDRMPSRLFARRNSLAFVMDRPSASSPAAWAIVSSLGTPSASPARASRSNLVAAASGLRRGMLLDILRRLTASCSPIKVANSVASRERELAAILSVRDNQSGPTKSCLLVLTRA
jgi:hypothetical protein